VLLSVLCSPVSAPRKFSMDDLLTNVMIYWTSGSIVSSMRFYKENFRVINPPHARYVHDTVLQNPPQVWQVHYSPTEPTSGLAGPLQSYITHLRSGRSSTVLQNPPQVQ